MTSEKIFQVAVPSTTLGGILGSYLTHFYHARRARAERKRSVCEALQKVIIELQDSRGMGAHGVYRRSIEGVKNETARLVEEIKESRALRCAVVLEEYCSLKDDDFVPIVCGRPTATRSELFGTHTQNGKVKAIELLRRIIELGR